MSTLSTTTSGARPASPSIGDTLYETDTKRVITCSATGPAVWRVYDSDGVAYSTAGTDELHYPTGLWASAGATYYLSVSPEMHFDATIMDGSYSDNNPADAGAVALWGDRSGSTTNYDATQGTAGSQPAWDASGSGSKPAIVCDGDFLDLATLYSPSSSFTQITVSKSNSATGTAPIAWNGAWQNTIWLKYSSNSGDYIVGGNRGNLSTVNAVNMHTVKRDGAGVVLYQAGGTSLGNWTSSDTMKVDRIAVSSLESHVGDISEILIFDSALSVAHLNVVRLYLTNKYGLTTGAFS
jgi:hypothetical protein